jgi:hypothetical protein
MQTLPLSAIANQTLTATLAGQDCTITLYQKATGLYADVSVAGVPLVQCVRVRDRIRWLRRVYLGFIGDLVMVDTQGLSDPTYDGLGSRYQLLYLETGDV